MGGAISYAKKGTRKNSSSELAEAPNWHRGWHYGRYHHRYYHRYFARELPFLPDGSIELRNAHEAGIPASLSASGALFFALRQHSRTLHSDVALMRWGFSASEPRQCSRN